MEEPITTAAHAPLIAQLPLPITATITTTTTITTTSRSDSTSKGNVHRRTVHEGPAGEHR